MSPDDMPGDARAAADGAVAAAPRRMLFPLVRHLSDRLTAVLLPLPVSPNQVTAASLATGLGCAVCFAFGSQSLALTGAALLIASYILDNCDGDIARAKKLHSKFGHYFDSVTDWLVDTTFFLGLGIGTTVASGRQLWLWLGAIAAVGATVSYVLEMRHDLRVARETAAQGGKADAAPDADKPLPLNWKEAVVYAFRELSRADFCFIVLVLAAFDVTWILLPAGAIGAQVYWLSSLVVGWRRFHV